MNEYDAWLVRSLRSAREMSDWKRYSELFSIAAEFPYDRYMAVMGEFVQ